MENEPNPQYTNPEKKIRNKKALFLLIALLCGIFSVFFILTSLSGKTHPSSTFHPTPSQASLGQPTTSSLPQIDTVVLTDTGFSPAKITIHKGSAVRWINKSSTDKASVNSDDYPTNQRYSELNLGKIGKGSAVAHIFTTPGNYTYHNQFNPKRD